MAKKQPAKPVAKKAATPAKAKDVPAKEPAKMGRPRKEIDFAVFEGLCRAQCTEVEIAGIFEMDTNTLNARIKEYYGETFSEVYKKKAVGGKVSLRRLQFKAAEAGNVTMQIWLGKQYLGQTDKQELTGGEGEPLLQPLAAALDKIYGQS